MSSGDKARQKIFDISVAVVKLKRQIVTLQAEFKDSVHTTAAEIIELKAEVRKERAESRRQRRMRAKDNAQSDSTMLLDKLKRIREIAFTLDDDSPLHQPNPLIVKIRDVLLEEVEP